MQEEIVNTRGSAEESKPRSMRGSCHPSAYHPLTPCSRLRSATSFHYTTPTFQVSHTTSPFPAPFGLSICGNYPRSTISCETCNAFRRPCSHFMIYSQYFCPVYFSLFYSLTRKVMNPLGLFLYLYSGGRLLLYMHTLTKFSLRQRVNMRLGDVTAVALTACYVQFSLCVQETHNNR